MDDLISRRKAIDLIENESRKYGDEYGVSDVLCDLADLPSAQPEIIRCKDCCYWDRETVRQNSNDVGWWNEAVCRKHSVDGNEPHEMWTDADWFCADRERRNEC